jgi:hypothetical protein
MMPDTTLARILTDGDRDLLGAAVDSAALPILTLAALPIPAGAPALTHAAHPP